MTLRIRPRDFPANKTTFFFFHICPGHPFSKIKNKILNLVGPIRIQNFFFFFLVTCRLAKEKRQKGSLVLLLSMLAFSA